MQKVLDDSSRARSHTDLERHVQLGVRTAAVVGRDNVEQEEEERNELRGVNVCSRIRLELHAEHADDAERVQRVQHEDADVGGEGAESIVARPFPQPLKSACIARVPSRWTAHHVP